MRKSKIWEDFPNAGYEEVRYCGECYDETLWVIFPTYRYCNGCGRTVDTDIKRENDNKKGKERK